ncbi:MAG TPA: MarR family transcriptional regulator [Jatrophihabitantaceae bacterium]|nr:MarR family transcriptional regulator [Jatrophihabitantaceae bacterium]HYU66391.1 MarR family transcriptional regulator [Jatrophihabitantaceae bacterium]
MSYDKQAIHGVSMALRQLVLGWDRYRESVANQLSVGTSEVVALGYLFQEGPLTPREIGLRLNLTSGSITALLDRLENSGFVARSQHPDDRRSLLATVTPAGRHAMQYFYEQLDTMVGDTLERYPDLPIETMSGLVSATGEALTARARAAKEGTAK